MKRLLIITISVFTLAWLASCISDPGAAYGDPYYVAPGTSGTPVDAKKASAFYGLVTKPSGPSEPVEIPTPPIESEKVLETYGLNSQTDEFEKITFTYSNLFIESPTFVSPGPLELYVGNNDGLYYLRGIIRYTGDDWIFFNKATLLDATGKTLSWKFELYDKDDDVGYNGSITERIDFYITHDEAVTLFEMFKSASLRFRVSGDSYEDYEFSEKYKVAMLDVLKYYLENDSE